MEWPAKTSLDAFRITIINSKSSIANGFVNIHILTYRDAVLKWRYETELRFK